MSDQPLPDIPLPSGPKNVKSAVLHVVSLACFAIIHARGLAAKGLDGSEDPRGGTTNPDHRSQVSEAEPVLPLGPVTRRDQPGSFP